MKYSIYTDGGCSGNKRDAGCKGAWAFVILNVFDEIIHSGAGREVNTTNNRMELTATIKGLEELINIQNKFGSKDTECTVYTDSKYVSDNFSDYVEGWKENGWRKSSGGSVINTDLWKLLCSRTPEFKSFKFQWVKGHSTNKFNQLVDKTLRDLLY